MGISYRVITRPAAVPHHGRKLVSRIVALTAITALLAAASGARADWTASSGAQLRYSDNVGNAQAPDDKVSDETLGGRLSLADVLPVGNAYLFSAGGDV